MDTLFTVTGIILVLIWFLRKYKERDKTLMNRLSSNSSNSSLIPMGERVPDTTNDRVKEDISMGSSSSLVRKYDPVPRRRQDRTKEASTKNITNGWFLAFHGSLYGQDRFRYDLEKMGLKIVPSRVKNLEQIYLIIGDCSDDILMKRIKENLNSNVGGAILMNVRSQDVWTIDLWNDDENWGVF